MNTNWTLRAKQRIDALQLKYDDLLGPLKVKTPSAVGHYLNGRREPSPEQLCALAITLKCSLDWLMFGEAIKTENFEGSSLKLLEKFNGLSPAFKNHFLAIIDVCSANDTQEQPALNAEHDNKYIVKPGVIGVDFKLPPEAINRRPMTRDVQGFGEWEREEDEHLEKCG